MSEHIALRRAYPGSFVLHEEPMVAYIDNVLDATECRHVIELARERLSRALVSEDEDGSISAGRTGSNAWLPHNTDAVTLALCRRIAQIVGIPLAHAEAMQVVHYGSGQEYRPHYDAYDLNTPRGQRCCRRGGQRMVTALVYLNEVEQGGRLISPSSAAKWWQGPEDWPCFIIVATTGPKSIPIACTPGRR